MERFVYLFYYFFQGILLFQVVFLFAFYANTRIKESLYFGLFLFFTGCNFFISTPELFYNSTNEIALNSWWFKLFNIPLVVIGNIFFTLFLRDFFGTLINNKTLTLIIRYALKIQYFLFIPFLLLYLLRRPTDIIFNVVNFVGLASCIWMTIIIVRKKMRYANLVAAGFAFYIIGSFLTSYMLIQMINGIHHLFTDKYPLFFVKCGILAIMICYLIAIIKKWHFQEKHLILQKLESALLLEKMNNQITIERSRIAADMHDDMGAGLSRMRYLSTAMKNEIKDDGLKKELDKLISGSDELVDKMNDIIWMLNSGEETLEDVLYYIRSQCSEMLDQANINFEYSLPDSFPDKMVSNEEKRNLYLVVKEAVHNAIKHSQATQVELSVQISDQLKISVIDNGIGFNAEQSKLKGNGLSNYQKRMAVLKGRVAIQSGQKGTTITFEIPLA
jgi:signal transduction histidine kinase